MTGPHVLVLGGTAEARALAGRLDASGVRVTSSLAGRVSRPALPVGEVRVGGLGGAAGLTAWVREHAVDAVVDATHPFAATMSEHAARSAETTGVPLVRLARPGWDEHPDAATWTWVPDHPAARAAAETLGEHPFVTTGRQTLHHHTGPWRERPVLVRLVEPPAEPLPAAWTVLLSRGPWDLDGEAGTMRAHGVDVLLTKDSGGPLTAAKLDAARTLGVPVVVVSRPPAPKGVRRVGDVDGVLAVLGEVGLVSDVGGPVASGDRAPASRRPRHRG